MKKIYLCFLFLLAACDGQPPLGYECGYENKNVFNRGCKDDSRAYKLIYSCDKERLHKFIIECAKAANPMSDEEGEDLVYQCEKTGRGIYCTEETEYFITKTRL